MADTDTTTTNVAGRETIAVYVIIAAGVGIAAIAVISLVGAAVPLMGSNPSADAAENFQRSVQTVFNALLPLFGTWVGTVLAYYFAKENYESAANTTKTLMGLDQKLKSIKITDAWIPYEQIVGVHLDAKKTAATVTVADLRALLSSKVTRIAVFSEAKAIQCLIHESALYKFGFGKADAATKTLAELIADADMKTIVTTFAVAPFSADGTLADAKTAMDKIDGAQDVFLTSHGKNDEPVLGWITNVIIADKSKA